MMTTKGATVTVLRLLNLPDQNMHLTIDNKFEKNYFLH